jgi:two-component system cell cycle response regulator DivK
MSKCPIMQVSSTTARERRPMILLAEDHEDTRRVYGMLLRHHGFDVETAATGSEAVEMACSVHPDLILMDIGLPVLDGWQAARLIKASPETRHIPLLAFSALIDSIADLRGDVVTFDGFISKPVSPQDLVRRIRAYLELLGNEPRSPTPVTPLRRGIAGDSHGGVAAAS